MQINKIDQRALKLLLRYDGVSQSYARSKIPLEPYQQQWIDECGITTEEEIDYLKAHGLAFELVDMKHDEAVKECVEYVQRCTKSHVTGLFLSSFSAGRPDFRSGFAPYAIMQTMPDHGFLTSAVPDQCAICSSHSHYREFDRTAWNKERYKYGSIGPQKNPYIIQFYLAQHLQLAEQQPTPDDFRIFNAILDMLRSMDAETKPKDVHKHLKKIGGFRETNDQCKRLLEALGIAGMLETEQHKGYLTKFTTPALAPSKSTSSNWAYPVDFWTGADGINQKALAFWFGDYPQIRLD